MRKVSVVVALVVMCVARPWAQKSVEYESLARVTAPKVPASVISQLLQNPNYKEFAQELKEGAEARQVDLNRDGSMDLIVELPPPISGSGGTVYEVFVTLQGQWRSVGGTMGTISSIGPGATGGFLNIDAPTRGGPQVLKWNGKKYQ